MIICLLASTSLVGQDNPPFELPEVQVKAQSILAEMGSIHAQEVDSTLLGISGTGSIADALTRNSFSFIKSYGSGGLATTSIRGGGASQSAIYWNGLPIESPMLGQLDLALLPATFIDEAKIHYGGDGAVWGSGAIAGVIDMQTRRLFDQGLTVIAGASIGSFSDFGANLQLDLSKKRYSGSTRFFHHVSQNDFTYSLSPALPEKRLQNAKVEQSGILHESTLALGHNHRVGIALWYQQADRQIPPLTTQVMSKQSQRDNVLRTSANWRMTHKEAFTDVKVAYFREEIDYRDPVILLRSRSEFQTILVKVLHTRYIGRSLRLAVGADHSGYEAYTEDYLKGENLNASSLYVLGTIKQGRWLIKPAFRFESSDYAGQVLLPSLTAGFKLNQHFDISASVKRVYRRPTMNDLFWRPGGNIDLLPESGFAEELGISYLTKGKSGSLSVNLTGYYRSIKDWILWAPRDGQFFWTPQNIAQVESYGLESQLEWKVKTGKLNWQLQAGYTRTISENKQAIATPMIGEGQQLYYVPKDMVRSGLGCKVGDFGVRYYQNYTGGVLTLGQPLGGYSLAGIELNYEYGFPKHRINLHFRADNLWDVNYRVVERRPMPGRNFTLSLHYSFNRPNSN